MPCPYKRRRQCRVPTIRVPTRGDGNAMSLQKLSKKCSKFMKHDRLWTSHLNSPHRRKNEFLGAIKTKRITN